MISSLYNKHDRVFMFDLNGILIICVVVTEHSITLIRKINCIELVHSFFIVIILAT